MIRKLLSPITAFLYQSVWFFGGGGGGVGAR